MFECFHIYACGAPAPGGRMWNIIVTYFVCWHSENQLSSSSRTSKDFLLSQVLGGSSFFSCHPCLAGGQVQPGGLQTHRQCLAKLFRRNIWGKTLLRSTLPLCIPYHSLAVIIKKKNCKFPNVFSWISHHIKGKHCRADTTAPPKFTDQCCF